MKILNYYSFTISQLIYTCEINNFIIFSFITLSLFYNFREIEIISPLKYKFNYYFIICAIK